MVRGVFSLSIVAAAASAFLLVGAPKAHAHCDGLDGPVVAAAREALETGNVNLALVWVKGGQEAELRQAFEKTLSERTASAEAREPADMRFFETLVRLHRAGEGAAYTGLKPAGRDLGPAIPAADRAIESGNPAALRELLLDAVGDGLSQQFDNAAVRKGYDPNDVAAGREYVEAYVQYVHWVERLYDGAGAVAHGEEAEPVHQD